MAQYKESMARMFAGKSSLSFENSANEHEDIAGPGKSVHSVATEAPSFFLLMKRNSDLILNVLFPLIWCFACILLMDKESFLGTLYMPFLGVFAAFLANCVPIGGGIVYIPAFYLLGVEMKLGVAFTVATMTFGNGLFGLLRWMKKDEGALIWESFRYTVIPSSVGTIIAVFCLPAPSVPHVRLLFAAFSALLAVFVLLAVYRGGVTNLVSGAAPTVKGGKENEAAKTEANGTPDIVIVEDLPPISATAATVVPASPHVVPPSGWWQVAGVSFLAGLILVPNIGIGPALTTYMMLSLVGYGAERALVTGIITGGWVSIVPFLIHIFYFDDVPYQLWIMVLPGVFFGAKYAPLVHDYIGIENILIAFACFLIATSVLFATH